MPYQPPARRLEAIAKLINASGTGYRATTQKSYSSTDRLAAGCRCTIHHGKGRRGVKLEVFDPKDVKVLRHDSSETYRCNRKVERWLCEQPALECVARFPASQWWS